MALIEELKSKLFSAQIEAFATKRKLIDVEVAFKELEMKFCILRMAVQQLSLLDGKYDKVIVDINEFAQNICGDNII